MPAPAPESPVVVAKVPRGLEGIRPAELKAHMESGFTKAGELSHVAKSSDKIQKQLGDIISVAATKVEQTHVDAGKRFGEVHAKRIIKDKEINDAKKDKRALGKKEGRLRKTVNQIERVKADSVDIQPESKVAFESEAVNLEKTVRASLEQANKEKVTASEKETKARSEKKGLGYGSALKSEWAKTPDNIKAKWNKGQLDNALKTVDEAMESIPIYYAGQEILVQRVQEQVNPDSPIPDAFYESAKSLDKAIKATRKEELRLARKIDKTVKDPALKIGRLTETVRGSHVTEDLAIQAEAQRIMNEVSDGVEISPKDEKVLGRAITAAANRVRKLIEQPGFGKRSLNNSLLTTEALNEAVESKKIFDPLRRTVYEHLSGKQKSVEQVMGCTINVVPDENGRLIEIQLPDENGRKTVKGNKKDRDWLYSQEEDEVVQTKPGETKLFARLVQIEHTEEGLAKRLTETKSDDILTVRALSEALKIVGKERAAVLKLANARINGVATADGVRSGAIKTKLGETTVKGVEAAGTAGIAAALTYYGTPRTFFHLVDIPHIAGISGHIENARNIVTAANTAMAPIREVITGATNQITALKELIATGPAQLQTIFEGLKGMSLNDINTAITSSKDAPDALNKLGGLLEKLNNMQSLTSQIGSAPDQITALQGANVDSLNEIAKVTSEAFSGTSVEQAAASRDLLIGAVATTVSAASFTDTMRNILGAPVRAISKLINGE